MAGLLEFIMRTGDRIDHLAARPEDDEDERLKKTILVFLTGFALSAVPCGGFYFLQAGASAAALTLFGYSAVSAALFAHLLISKDSFPSDYAHPLLLLAVPAAAQCSAGGFAGSGAFSLWALLSPLCALMFFGPRGSIPWFTAFLVLIIGLGAGETVFPPALSERSGGAALLFVENLLLVSCIVYFTLRHFTRERENARAALEEKHRQLEAEQERSERLLLNILPKPIADRLKDRTETIADGFAEATVLFADIVGFTTLSAKTPPAELVGLLNEVFSEFDELSGKYRVEKIKTIGDAYMVCAGLPEPRPDHASVIADMALEMKDALKAFNARRGTSLDIRIGINSGPVVAGVIGTKKFIYDLWGDTVNTASRMESHGVPGRIQVTESAKELLGDAYAFEAREPIEVKGKGRMQTFLLSRLSAHARSA
jgi:guanylate cyclase